MATLITASEARLQTSEFRLTGAQVVSEYEGMIKIAMVSGHRQVGKTFPGHAFLPPELELALSDFRSRGFEVDAHIGVDHVRITVAW